MVDQSSKRRLKRLRRLLSRTILLLRVCSSQYQSSRQSPLWHCLIPRTIRQSERRKTRLRRWIRGQRRLKKTNRSTKKTLKILNLESRTKRRKTSMILSKTEMDRLPLGMIKAQRTKRWLQVRALCLHLPRTTKSRASRIQT